MSKTHESGTAENAAKAADAGRVSQAPAPAHSPLDLKLHTYRYGERKAGAGLFIGVTRHLPRGVRKEEYSSGGYFDVWFPVLAPSRELLSAYHAEKITFQQLASRYRAEMREPGPRHAIQLVAAMARQHPVHLGCYCEDPAYCHRTLLEGLVSAAARELPPEGTESAKAPGASAGAGAEADKKYASPACAMPEVED